MLNDRMESRDLVIGVILLSETAVGFLGNFSLLSYYLVLCYKKFTMRYTSVILTHLTIANSLTLLSKGVPQTLAAFGLKQLFNDQVCDLILYAHRLSRNMSIGTTCLLSIFQAITISPRNSCWKVCKAKVSRYIHVSISFYWIVYMVVNLIFPVYFYSKLNIRNVTRRRDFKYCPIGDSDGIMDLLYAALFVFPEVLLSVLIISSSGFMVVILYRHKQRVQHIRSTNVSSRGSPESRATRSILALVSTFVTFYTLSSILNAGVVLLNNSSRLLMTINSIISMGFPCFGPFILMSHDFTMSRLCSV